MRFNKLVSSESKNFSDENKSSVIKLIKEVISEVSWKVKKNLFLLEDYNSLKIKEYYWQLTLEEFKRLLYFDFSNHLKENPPIWEIFSPEEELNKLKILPKEKKRKALNVFKERLAIQRKAWRQCICFIERMIEFDNDISKNMLINLINNWFAEKYGFSVKQKKIANQLINMYYESRKTVLKIRKKYPDNVVLVKNLTGVDLKNNDNLEVSVWPMTIDIITNWSNLVELLKWSYKEFNKKPKYLDSLDISSNFGGFASFSEIEGEIIFYTVINKDIEVEWEVNDLLIQKILLHEYQHQKNRFFRRVFRFKANYINYEYMISQYNEEKDPFTKKIILEEYFNSRILIAFERVKDEIIASLCDRSLSELANELSDMFFSQNENSYDYLYRLRYSNFKKDDILYEELSEKILVKKYRATIEKAVDALFKLKKEWYSEKELIYLVIDKPLPDWHKTVNRLLKSK